MNYRISELLTIWFWLLHAIHQLQLRHLLNKGHLLLLAHSEHGSEAGKVRPVCDKKLGSDHAPRRDDVLNLKRITYSITTQTKWKHLSVITGYYYMQEVDSI